MEAGNWSSMRRKAVIPRDSRDLGLIDGVGPAARPRCLDSARHDLNSDYPCSSVVGSGFQDLKSDGNGAGNGGQTTNGANGTNIGGENGANGRSAFSGGSYGLICVNLRSFAVQNGCFGA